MDRISNVESQTDRLHDHSRLLQVGVRALGQQEMELALRSSSTDTKFTIHANSFLTMHVLTEGVLHSLHDLCSIPFDWNKRHPASDALPPVGGSSHTYH